MGHNVFDQTAGDVLRRFGIAPAPKRRQKMNWAHFIRAHMAVLAGMDFFIVEVLTWGGLATYYAQLLVKVPHAQVEIRVPAER